MALLRAVLNLDQLPIELRGLLQQLQLNPIGNHQFGDEIFGADDASTSSDSDSEEDPITKVDFSKLSTTTFVEPALSTRYSVRTGRQHYQLLNLCELTGGISKI